MLSKCSIIPIESEVIAMTMYRVYARFIPTDVIRSTVTNIAGVNALERHPLWDVLAIEQIKINEEI